MFDGGWSPTVVFSMGTGSYRVVRRKAAVESHGKTRPSPAKPDEFQIEASVQPASGRDLKMLPEGRRTEEMKTVFTTSRLQVGGQGTGVEADRVVINGQEYEVQNVKEWPGHFECVVLLASLGAAPAEVNPRGP